MMTTMAWNDSVEQAHSHPPPLPLLPPPRTKIVSFTIKIENIARFPDDDDNDDDDDDDDDSFEQVLSHPVFLSSPLASLSPRIHFLFDAYGILFR